MNRRILAAILSFSVTGNIAVAEENVSGSTATLESQGKAIIQAFAKDLKASLKQAIQQGGFVKGVEACSIKASSIALEHSDKHWIISRTSLKPRNPENVPTIRENKILLNFEKALKSGTPASALAYKEVTERNGAKQLFMMKAIPTQSLCLACHGQNIAPEVQAILNQKYPQDKAIGYSEGEIRGAFSLTYTP